MNWTVGSHARQARITAGLIATLGALSSGAAGCGDCIGEFPPYDVGFAVPDAAQPWPAADSGGGSFDPDAGALDDGGTTGDVDDDGRGEVDRDVRDPLDGWGPGNPAPERAAAAAGSRHAPGVVHASSPGHRIITVSGPSTRPIAASPGFRLIREVSGRPPATP